MNRTRGCLLAAMTAAAIPAGCKTQSSTELFIGGVLLPPTTTAGTVCSYTANATGPFNLEPVLDLSLFEGSQPTYTGIFLIGNQLQSTASSAQLRVESSRVILDDAIVYVQDGTGATISAFTTPVSGELDPGSGATPSYIAIGILALDGHSGEVLGAKTLSSKLTQTATAQITLRGKTIGGDSVQSAPFEQKIDTCVGCLVVPVPAAGCGTSTSTGDVPCQFGQDQPVDCCTFPEPICNGTLPTFDAGAP